MRPAIQKQLLLPLLEVLKEAGGRARPGEIYTEVADRIGLTDEERAETFEWRGRQLNAFKRQVRWTRQTCRDKEFLSDSGERGVWQLSDLGKGKLHDALPGVVVTVIETGLGKALWASVEDAIGHIEDGSVDLLFSSPPYALIDKTYGQWSEADWEKFMLDLAQGMRPKLSPAGSMMFNLGYSYLPDRPAVSTYVERFTIRMEDQAGFKLLDRLFWRNKNRLASPFKWVALRRCRLKPSVEPILWFGNQDGETHACNRRVLTPYKDAQRSLIGRDRPASKIGARPSGHVFGRTSFTKDNGGAIPDVVIDAGVGGSAKGYYRGCKEDGILAHPATMPESVARFCVEFATRPGDLVFDPFGGSLTTAAACEATGRRWITSERSLVYLAGGRHRLPGDAQIAPGLVSTAQAASAPMPALELA